MPAGPRLGRGPRRRCADRGKDSRADDGADAKQRELHRAKRPLKLLVGFDGFPDQVVKRLSAKQAGW